MPSVEHTQPQRSCTDNDEIDLIDLVMQLWRAKITIILFVVAALILSGIYLVVAKEKWSSEAIITLPDSGQTANYMNAINVLYAQNPSNAPTTNEVQQRAFGRFNALISAFSEQLANQEEKEDLTLEPTVKGQTMPLKVTYVGDSAENAKATLTKYLNQINRQAVTEIDKDLTVNINSRIADLKESLSAQEMVASEQRKQRLAVISQALKVAEASGIKKAMVNQAETQSEDTLYLLGSDALGAMMENESTRPLPLGGAYFSTRQALVAVNQLKSQPDSLYTFRYVMEPNLPFRKDSPKRALVLILAVLLGGVIGCGYVLGRNALRDYNNRHAA